MYVFLLTFHWTPDASLQKIILHLKNASKCVAVKSDDEDDNTGVHLSEYSRSYHAYILLF